MDLKEICLDCGDKNCSSRNARVLRFCYRKNKLSSFKRKADFVNNIHLPCHISCVGFSLRILSIVIGLWVLELLWLTAHIQIYQLRPEYACLLIFTVWRVVLSQTQIITSYILSRNETRQTWKFHSFRCSGVF
jgi:hypothetical protein